MQLSLSSSFKPFKPLLTAVSCCGLMLAGAAFSGAQAQTYNPPITIADAGPDPSSGCTATSSTGIPGPITKTDCTFSGNWESMSEDPNTSTPPVVTINTSRPVLIQNSRLRGKNTLIYSSDGNHPANITVRNTRGYGLLNMTQSGKQKGRFLKVSHFTNIRVENCYLESTGGISVQLYDGDGSSNQTVHIVNNVARNLDGRWSNGTGGYRTVGVNAQGIPMPYPQGTPAPTQEIRYNGKDNSDKATYDKVSFVQIANTNYRAGSNWIGLSNAEIAWNEEINYPYQSRVEDSLSVYSDGTDIDNDTNPDHRRITSGKSASDPIKIHDNYVQGGYPTDPAHQGFAGLGVIVDGPGNYVEAYNNQVVAASAIGIEGGAYNKFYDNRIVASGFLPDGTSIKYMEDMGALSIWDYRQSPNDGDMKEDTAWNNTGKFRRKPAYLHSDGRTYSDGPVWFQSPNYVTPPNGVNIYTANPIQTSFTYTQADEQTERAAWTGKLAGSNAPASIGPTLENNLIVNRSFENDAANTQTPSNWNESGDVLASKVETDPGVHGNFGSQDGSYHATHWSASAYEVTTYSYPTGLTQGLYTAKVWVRSGGGQDICRFIVSDRGNDQAGVALPAISRDIPTTGDSGGWQQLVISDIQVSTTHCKVALYSKAAGGKWMYFDNVELRKQ